MANIPKHIWLEVERARLDGDDLKVRLKADKGDLREQWFPYDSKKEEKDDTTLYDRILSGQDKNQIVLAMIAGEVSSDASVPVQLRCKSIRFQSGH